MHAAFSHHPSGLLSKLPMPAEMGAPVFFFSLALPGPKLWLFHIKKKKRKKVVNICHTQQLKRFASHTMQRMCAFSFLCVGEIPLREEGSCNSWTRRKKKCQWLTAYHRHKRQAHETACHMSAGNTFQMLQESVITEHDTSTDAAGQKKKKTEDCRDRRHTISLKDFFCNPGPFKTFWFR